jgi:signal transduction histidine kinase
VSGGSRIHLPLPLLKLKGFTLQLFGLIILPLTALLLVIAFGSLSLHHHAMRSLVGERDLRAANAAAAAIAYQIQQRGMLLQWLAVQSDRQEQFQLPPDSAYLNSMFDRGIAYFSSDYQLLGSTNDRFWSSPQAQAFLNDFLPSAGQEASFSGLFDAAPEYGPVIFISAANSDGLTAAAAFSPADLVLTALADSFDNQAASILVFDADLRPIFQYGPFAQDEELSSHTGILQAIEGGTGITYSRIHGEEHVIAYTSIGSVGWGLIMEEAWQQIANPMLRTTQIAPLILAPVLLLAIIALWFGAAQVIRPLQALEAQAQELSHGKYSAVEEPVGGIPEIQSLQGGLIHMSRRLKAAQESLRGYIGSITKSQEDERRRLARELHDDTLQSLIALNQRLQIARMDLNGQPGGDSLGEIETLNEKTIQNLRRLTRALRPIYLEDLGLPASLDILAQETSSALRIPVEFHMDGQERRLSPEEELSLYRISQEALSNISRHSDASRAVINLSYKNDEVLLTILDNGCGFSLPDTPSIFAKQGHFGLLGLHERAELIGAKLDIQTSPGKGVLLSIHLEKSAIDPLKEKA